MASVPFGKDQDLLSTGIELQVVMPGLEPELESPQFVKLGHSALGWEGCPGKGEGDRGHILIQEGWADPSYVR